MKISYNWLKQYIQMDLTAEAAAEVLTAIGLEVESVERVQKVPGGLEGVVVGHVIECGKHPDADRLSLTRVDLGQGEPVQIVCGAPNVAQGQKVLVATIGAKLYPTEGEPFVIKKGKIRGQDSHGMICAEDELGLGKSHAGIMVLEETAAVGTPAADYLGMSDDFCLEIGLTPNRTDAFSHFGVARDLHAALRNMEREEQVASALVKPEVAAIPAPAQSEAIQLSVESTEACPRYAGVLISGVKVGPSPEWLKERLIAIGQRSINNIVDITNFIQHEIGQPMHAFDADKIGGAHVRVRLAAEGEKITTLDGVERTLCDQDLVIADQERAMCIAGVLGGSDSGVSESTTRVFLESAYFHPVFVRKTAKRQGIHSDSSFRFERGCDPHQVIWALHRAVQLITTEAGGAVASQVFDQRDAFETSHKVDLNWKRAMTLIGKEIPRDKVRSILTDLDICITAESEEGLQLEVPLYRTDVQREADVVEEILRIYGYNNIEIPTRMQSSLSRMPQPNVELQQRRVAELLASIGFHETMSMSLSGQKHIQENEQLAASAVAILNPLSGDLAIMRQSLLYGAMQAVELNQNHKSPDLRLFEFGKVYNKYTTKYHEERRLSITVTGSRMPESWNNTSDKVSFVDVRMAVDRILSLLGIGGVQYKASEHALYDEAIEVFSGKTSLGFLGSLKGGVLKAFDVRQEVFFAELNWDNIIQSLPQKRVSYRQPEKFPSVRRDLSLLLDKAVRYAEIEKLALETERKLLREVNLFDVYEGKNLEAGKKSYAVSFTLQDSGKTMTDQQVDQVMSRIQAALAEKLGATLR
ncbi:MAG: phenylalanine--tRNA ligase subunit beta [Flavobacteriales bacterium]|jgi:phenylalanyl-tRNA synthetase beta chain